jgi:methylthioribose-1-phosphate isomerase
MIDEEKSNVRTLIWEDTSLRLIDQRKLPFEITYVRCRTAKEVADAIRDMVVRGAPAIGVSAAYGVVLGALELQSADTGIFFSSMKSRIKLLSESRPTAINLDWALERMKKVMDRNCKKDIPEITTRLTDEAKQIEKEDVEINCRIGENSLELFKEIKKLKVLTHCNAGALATAGYGTALGVIRSLFSSGRVEHVIVDETRPYLQGSRLTAWELHAEKIPFFIITDNMAGYFISRGEVDVIIVGADRIAANGDIANKIGTLSLSIMAKFYNIPFYVAAPLSTIDLKADNGKSIPIEQREQEEVRKIQGKTIIPEYMPVSNPAFDVSPNENISAIITEKDIVYPPYTDNLKKLFSL